MCDYIFALEQNEQHEQKIRVDGIDETWRAVDVDADRNVNHPDHYTSSPAKCPACGGTIECITIAENFNFCIGNTIKYLWRCDKKDNGKYNIVDLKKAKKYIAFEIQRRAKAVQEGTKI